MKCACHASAATILQNAVLLVAAAFSTLPAFAATDVVSNLNDSGPGSLRATIAAAASGDTIVFQAGLTGPITLTTGSAGCGLTISQNLTISGPGTTVQRWARCFVSPASQCSFPA
jgi:hypothetical protein